MPLLRLLLQISNMYQNVKETQSELREQQPENKVAAKTPPATALGEYTSKFFAWIKLIDFIQYQTSTFKEGSLDSPSALFPFYF